MKLRAYSSSPWRNRRNKALISCKLVSNISPRPTNSITNSARASPAPETASFCASKFDSSAKRRERKRERQTEREREWVRERERERERDVRFSRIKLRAKGFILFDQLEVPRRKEREGGGSEETFFGDWNYANAPREHICTKGEVSESHFTGRESDGSGGYAIISRCWDEVRGW